MQRLYRANAFLRTRRCDVATIDSVRARPVDFVWSLSPMGAPTAGISSAL